MASVSGRIQRPSNSPDGRAFCPTIELVTEQARTNGRKEQPEWDEEEERGWGIGSLSSPSPSPFFHHLVSAAMDPSFVQNLHALLVQSTSNDTVQLKAATAQLNREFYKNPLCIPGLTQIIAESPEQAVRQLAAVELRKRVSQKDGDLWLQLETEQREQIKVKLPELVLSESSNLVRHSTARVIAAIASIEMPLGTWPQLLPFLEQTCLSAQASHREVGVYILFTILENIVEGFETHIQSFFKLFEKLLQDPESAEVRITTVRALGVVAQYIDVDDKEDIKTFQNLLPGMINVIGQCVEGGNEAGAHIPQLAEFLLRIGGNRNYDADLRVLALNALNWTVQ
ncbi:hypothetical protein NUW54_g4176 [Trametes sanguinea]|uniref:Uncharacterized protein n=1 Tax=Trametes sanguinea TaxID=158606 RepID=A0ACC1Q1S1_9APHY|nr:hypothetical protein NUW54_g4176 [Trametes sanguinea]